MLPEGGAGALRRHEAIRQGGGTHGTRQVHREPRVLVCGPAWPAVTLPP